MQSTTEMTSEQLSIKWNGFTDNIITSFERSLGNQDFVDVTLVCEGGSIKAHRLVLSACSYFFQRVLKENVCPHPVIVLKGIALSELETLLMFIYHGETRTYKDNIHRLLETATFLEIRGLAHESTQVTSVPVIPKEPSEVVDEIENDFLLTESKTSSQELNKLLSHTENFNPSVNRTECQGERTEFIEYTDEATNHTIKQEPLEEEANSKETCSQTVDSPTKSTSKSTSEELVSHCLPNTNFTIQEKVVLQQQKKLAFYEPRPCPRCHRVYRDAATLRNHLASMHEVLRHKVMCSCGSAFLTKHDLYTHRRRHHRGGV